jgi:Fe-Mn family superoxide dismutase
MNVMAKTEVFTLPPLPYDESALAPTISAQTMRFHYGKHHKAYVDKLNELVTGTAFARMQLEDVVKATSNARDHKKQQIFHNAAQNWNHTFFWACLTPQAGKPKETLLAAMERDLGGYEEFKRRFIEEGLEQFGSGWVWLVADNGRLRIEKTHDAVTPMADGLKCLLTIDVWEHAYYLDYQNRRQDFLKAVVGRLLNWDFAAQNFERSG